MFFNQLIFDTSHLFKFITRIERLKALSRAEVVFSTDFVQLRLAPKAQPGPSNDARLSLSSSCRESDWQLSSVTQFCTSSLPSLLTMESLYVSEHRPTKLPHGLDDIEKAQWMEALHPFTAVKDLHLTRELVVRVLEALQELPWESGTNILPALQSLFIEGFEPSESLHESITQFVTARQLAGRPVALHHWEREIW
ncbi:hypothetical protein BJV74DRAFT_821446 [Russula compacta]|nr:hypothetical protein BJV74DRAFT_821446 [Russula compacta]